MNSKIKICSKCVMDTTDQSISFDHKGICNHCYRYDEKNNIFSTVKKRENELRKIIMEYTHLAFAVVSFTRLNDIETDDNVFYL